jgi:hypothetical protein
MTARLTQAKSRGQILLIYGVGAMSIMGFSGLAVDGGHIFTQKRLAQNGADAGALVGTRDIVKGSFGNVDSDVTTYAKSNAGTTATVNWNYVNNAGATVGSSSATGVTVLVTNTFDTLFIRALGIGSFTVTARGTARAQLLQGASGAPFIVCAGGLKKDLTGFPGGILDYTTTPPTIKPSAVWPTGPEFVVHGSKVGQSDPNGDCNWSSSSSFKGNTPEGVTQSCPTLPCWYQYDTGNKAGPAQNRVAGMPSCNADDGTELSANCVAILPIAAMKDTPADTCSGSPSSSMCIVAWGAFELRVGGQPGDPDGCNSSNCHIGRIRDQVIVTEGAGVDWTPGTTGPMVVRLLG